MKQNSKEFTAWDTISGKEYKSVKIGLIVSSILFVIALVVQIILNNYYLYIVSVLMFALFAGMAIALGFLVNERKLFLNSEQVEAYAEEILSRVLATTPTEVITENYIFLRKTASKPIILEQVEWIYRKKVNAQNTSSDNIVFCMRNGNKRTMVRRVSLSESDLYGLIKKKNERVLIGWSDNNKQRYKEIVEHS